MLLLVFGSISLPASAQSTSTGYPDLDLFYSQSKKNYRKALVERKRYLMENTPHEQFITDYMERGAAVLRDTVSLFNFFSHAPIIYSKEERQQVLDEVYAAARKYKSKRLKLAADYFKIFMIEFLTKTIEVKVEGFERVIRTSRKIGEPHIEILALNEMRGATRLQYARSFAYAHRLEEALNAVSEDDYPDKNPLYSHLAISAYQFKDYKQAIPLFHKALAYPGANVRTWNYLAVYHHRNGNLDSAAYYHRTILASHDALEQQPAHLAIAISNLGRLELAAGNYDAAIAMLQAGLQVMRPPTNELSFVVGLYTSLGEARLAKGEVTAAKKYIDSICDVRSRFIPADWQPRAIAFFALQSQYYAHVGRHDLSKVYLDSALMATQIHMEFSGQHFVRMGEQQLQAAEIEKKAQKVAQQRLLLIIGTVALIVILTGLVFILRLYKRKNAAYKVLARKAEQWATANKDDVAPTPDSSDSSDSLDSPDSLDSLDSLDSPTCQDPITEEERQIMAAANREMHTAFAYRQAELTLNSFAEQLSVPRNTLSKAVNKITGKNFNTYINEYRIKEAVRIMTENQRADAHLYDFYEQIGFNNRVSFYRAFKQFTGLSPMEFQKQQKKSD